MKAFFKQAQDPRRFWITVYDSENGPVFSGSHRLHPNQNIELKFLTGPDSPLPMFKVQGRGPREFTALIDTSSKECWTAFETFPLLGLTPLGPPAYESFPDHVSDTIRGFLSVLSTLKMGHLHIETVLVHVRAANGGLGAIGRQTDPAPDLVLGYPLLQSLRFFQLDYPAGVFRASSTLPYTPSDADLVATAPLEEMNGLLVTEGMVDGISGPILLDSAGDFALVLPGGTGSMAKHVGLGDLVLRNVEVQSGEGLELGDIPLPRVGRQLLGRFKVTVDNFQKIIYFERPDK